MASGEEESKVRRGWRRGRWGGGEHGERGGGGGGNRAYGSGRACACGVGVLAESRVVGGGLRKTPRGGTSKNDMTLEFSLLRVEILFY
jgi:hypothetical protein